MKALFVLVLIFIVIGFIIALWVISMYNNFIKGKNLIEEAYSTMDVYLKKRFDLIPNLVNTVKGYAAHEKNTLTAVTQARAAIGKAQSEGERFKAESFLTQALGRLFAVAEQYPNLMANENFMNLQEQLSSIEDEIAHSRVYYNATVKEFNTSVEMFPANIIANMFGFRKYSMYEVANETERENVKVEF